MSKRVLITGGAGFIAHHTIKYYLENTDWEIVSLDRLDYSGNLNRISDLMNGYDEIISNDLKPNDIIKAPQWNWYKKYKDCHWDLYRYSRKGEFIKFKQYEKTDDEIVNFEITELGWFQIDKILYFPSRSMKKIAKLSEYWTDEGQSFLMNRRKEYLMVRDNPEFGPNQVKAYKRIPYKWTSEISQK